MFKNEKSSKLLNQALKVIPGGVNSPVRAFNAVGGEPPFIQRGSGCRIYDVDGNEYIDYVCSWGPLILGHAHPLVLEAVKEAAVKGTSFGAPTEAEVRLAELIVELVPSIDKVRLVNSGTEATASAIRLARGYTKRKLIIKFDGHYHGCADSLLIKAGSGAATFGLPDSPGVPDELAKLTITLPFNDVDALKEAMERYGNEVAALIMEPVAGNMGVVPAEEPFLQVARELTNTYGTLLIFDEVMCGFRIGLNGAQGLYGIMPDLTCLGKVIGGGLPVGAYGGRGRIMDLVAPLGAVYQAGTLSGNPLATAAGLATLTYLKEHDPFELLAQRVEKLAKGLEAAGKEKGIPLRVNRLGSMFTVYFNDQPIRNFADAKKSDTKAFSRFFWNCLRNGVYLPPSQFEAAFLSIAHTDADIDKTLEVMAKALQHFTLTL